MTEDAVKKSVWYDEKQKNKEAEEKAKADKEKKEQLNVKQETPIHTYGNEKISKLEGEYQRTVGGLAAGYKPTKISKELNALEFWDEYLRKANAVMDGLERLQNNAFPELAKAKEEAKKIVNKPQVSRTALDALQERGPVQMEEPEPPSLVNMAAQMILGGMGQAIQTFTQPDIASAESTQTAAVVSENASDYMAAQFASFEQNRQRVLEINTQLAAQYQGDIINMMRDFDARADAAEQNYERALLEVAFDKVENDMKLFYKQADIAMASAQLKIELGLREEEAERQAEMFNAEQENIAKRVYADNFTRVRMAQSQLIANSIQAERDAIAMAQKYKMDTYGNNVQLGNKTFAMFGLSSTAISRLSDYAIYEQSLPLDKSSEGLANSIILETEGEKWDAGLKVLDEMIDYTKNDGKEKMALFLKNATSLMSRGYTPKINLNKEMVDVILNYEPSGTQIPAEVEDYFYSNNFSFEQNGETREGQYMDSISLSALGFKGACGAWLLHHEEMEAENKR